MSEDTKQQEEDIQEDQQGFLVWIKAHRKQLVLAGVGVAALIAAVLGMKNKEAVAQVWKSLKELIEKGSIGSDRWFQNADPETLEKVRNVVHQEYLNPKNDMDYRNWCWSQMKRLDEAIRSKKYGDKEVGFPVYSDHGPYLLSDD